MKRRSGESGFALLLVFAMAAAVGILLYMEVPRAAFEAQRQRELLLIDRGEQYQRAIQLYFRKTRRFPANLEQLENTNNYRFLRRRYKDPITGKDEWRLIHIGPGGMLTDSLTQKPPGLQKGAEQAKEGTGDPAQPGAAELPSAVARRRASESGPGLPGSVPPGGVTQPGAQPPGQEGQPGQYAAYPPGQPGGYYPQPQPGQSYPPAQTFPPEPGQEPQVGATYVVPGQPGSYQTSTPGQPGAVTYYQPGQPVPVPGIQPGQAYQVMQPGQPYPITQPGQPYTVTQPGQSYPTMSPVQSYPPAQPYQPYPVTPVQTGTYPPPYQPPSPVRISPGQPPPGFIQGLLSPGRPGAFSPNVPPQGMPASSQTGGQSPMPYQYAPGMGPSVPVQAPAGGGTTNPALEMIRKILTTPRPGGLAEAQVQQTFSFGAGIAGVASKAEAPSIIMYNERDRYNEWEFIYDMRKDRTMVGPAGVAGSQPGALLQQPAGSSTTMMPPQSPSPPPVGPGGRGR